MSKIAEKRKKRIPPIKHKYFSKIQEAREVLRERALEFVELQLKIINEAIRLGDLETASKANQWLMEHTPSDTKGDRMVEQSIDKPKQIEGGQSGPQINIGFALGGVAKPKELPPAPADDPDVIDITHEADPK